VDQPNYRVLLEGHMVGPYDRRTIVGMRIRHTLSSDHLLISSDGSQLTVGELIGQGPPADRSQPNRTSGSSRVRATSPASLIDADRGALRIPRFRGELEARLQGEVLRIAGRYRRLFGWKEDRVKIALTDIVHARVTGSRVDLWLRGGGQRLQRIGLELFTLEAAGAFVAWLPAATPFPEPAPIAGVGPLLAYGAPVSTAQALGVAVIGVSLVIGLMLLVLVYRRVY
jgi:hypothetical protein